MLQLKLFSQVFFIPMSLYPLMYLDKKRNKDFFFLRGQSWALSQLCFFRCSSDFHHRGN